MSVLFGTDEEGEQMSPGERAREGLERGASLAIATTAALPPERPVLRAARGEGREEIAVRTSTSAASLSPARKEASGGKPAVGRRQWHATAEKNTREDARTREKN